MTSTATTTSTTAHAGPLALSLEGVGEGFVAALAPRMVEPGLWIVRLTLESSAPAVPTALAAHAAPATPVVPPAAIRLNFRAPLRDMVGLWHCNARANRALTQDFRPLITARATLQAPVICAFNDEGRNRLTFACADALHTTLLHAGVERAHLVCWIEPCHGPLPAATRYETEILFDMRDIAYQDALAHVTRWWESHEGYAPAAVPEHARLPMYSTWYSFLQHLDAAAIVRQCHLAKEIGCESIIVDDGWQPVEEKMGYRYCGDWEPESIADMPAFVRNCQDAGLKFLLWYGTPLIGHATKAYARYKHMMLYDLHWTPCSVFDPRFPEMREHLIGRLEHGMREWGLDGVKLDFVDLFVPPEQPHSLAAAEGRDMEGVPEAGDLLLTHTMERLRAIRPDVMVEFRQWYIGPLMRKYGNMLRAADCPDCPTSNRVRTLDVRLLAGATPAHSDMLEWDGEASVEVAAMQILHSLFSVPQISVLLDRIPREHVAMLRFWLAFWRTHRDVLLDGYLEPLSPHWLYPVVRSSTPQKRIVAAYADAIADVGEAVPETLLLVNGTPRPGMVILAPQPLGRRRMRVFDTVGACVSDARVTVPSGVHRLDVPAAGLVTLEAE
jgi:alpha-galactosidase